MFGSTDKRLKGPILLNTSVLGGVTRGLAPMAPLTAHGWRGGAAPLHGVWGLMPRAACTKVGMMHVDCQMLVASFRTSYMIEA